MRSRRSDVEPELAHGRGAGGARVRRGGERAEVGDDSVARPCPGMRSTIAATRTSTCSPPMSSGSVPPTPPASAPSAGVTTTRGGSSSVGCRGPHERVALGRDRVGRADRPVGAVAAVTPPAPSQSSSEKPLHPERRRAAQRRALVGAPLEDARRDEDELDEPAASRRSRRGSVRRTSPDARPSRRGRCCGRSRRGPGRPPGTRRARDRRRAQVRPSTGPRRRRRAVGLDRPDEPAPAHAPVGAPEGHRGERRRGDAEHRHARDRRGRSGARCEPDHRPNGLDAGNRLEPGEGRGLEDGDERAEVLPHDDVRGYRERRLVPLTRGQRRAVRLGEARERERERQEGGCGSGGAWRPRERDAGEAGAVRTATARERTSQCGQEPRGCDGRGERDEAGQDEEHDRRSAARGELVRLDRAAREHAEGGQRGRDRGDVDRGEFRRLRRRPRRSSRSRRRRRPPSRGRAGGRSGRGGSPRSTSHTGAPEAAATIRRPRCRSASRRLRRRSRRRRSRSRSGAPAAMPARRAR